MITKSKAIETATADVHKLDANLQEKAAEGLKQSAAAAAAGLEQVQGQVKEGANRAMKTAEQVAAFSQGNVEAMMKSSQILAAGLTDLGKVWVETARANMEDAMGTLRAITSVKSVKEAVDLQTSFARSSMEKAMHESGRLTEQSMKLAEQAFAPITARVNAAVETFS